MLREEGFNDLLGFILILGYEALIKNVMGIQRSFPAQKKGNEFQIRHAFADDHQTNRQGRGENQPDGTPEPGPEGDHN